MHYTISIGVALAGPGEPVESIIQRADEALYAAKAAGRDRWLMAGLPGAAVELATPTP